MPRPKRNSVGIHFNRTGPTIDSMIMIAETAGLVLENNLHPPADSPFSLASALMPTTFLTNREDNYELTRAPVQVWPLIAATCLLNQSHSQLTVVADDQQEGKMLQQVLQTGISLLVVGTPDSLKPAIAELAKLTIIAPSAPLVELPATNRLAALRTSRLPSLIRHAPVWRAMRNHLLGTDADAPVTDAPPDD